MFGRDCANCKTVKKLEAKMLELLIYKLAFYSTEIDQGNKQCDNGGNTSNNAEHPSK